MDTHNCRLIWLNGFAIGVAVAGMIIAGLSCEAWPIILTTVALLFNIVVMFA